MGFWAAKLLESKKTMDSTLAGWVEQWALCGTSKLIWERFFNSHGPQRPIKFESTLQATTMTIQQAGEPRRIVETVVVWNGNGARARWADKAELKQVYQACDPDVLCFLEGKTDAENLLKLPNFREWVTTWKIRQINCYWSSKADKRGFGNEGIILFSKIPCAITCGIGDAELDR